MAQRALNQCMIYGAEWEREGFSGLLFWLGSGNSVASSALKLGNKPDLSVNLPALPRPRSLLGAGVGSAQEERQRLEHL